MLDWGRPMHEEERDLLRSLDGSPALVVLNKVDLPCGIGMDRVLFLRKWHAGLEISAKNDEGIPDFRRRLAEAAGGGSAPSREETFVTNVRHHDLMLKAAAALSRSEAALGEGVGEEYAVLDLRSALDHLGEITGEVGIDGIYDRIFKNFCIGK